MTLPPTEALSYSCLPEDVVLVARGLRRYHTKSEARRPFPHSQFGFSAVLRGWYCAGGLFPSMGAGIAPFSFRRSSSICQAAGMSAKNAAPFLARPINSDCREIVDLVQSPRGQKGWTVTVTAVRCRRKKALRAWQNVTGFPSVGNLPVGSRRWKLPLFQSALRSPYRRTLA